MNLDDCKVIHIGYKNLKANNKLFNKKVAVTEKKKDFGVCVTSNLKFKQQFIRVKKRVRKF